MDRWKGKVAVVTGTSAGIGAQIAEQLVEAGLKVVGLARRKERTQALAKKLAGKRGQLYAVKADISKEGDIVAAFKWIKENVGPVHILVNNAGIIRGTDLINGDTKMWKEILDTNVIGLCVATREAVKDMRANNVDGHIIHINSVVGHIVPNLPQFNVYPASKHAVTALTETLRQELNSIGSKIKISSVSPGGTQTEIVQATGSAMPKEIEEYLKKATAILKPEDIADAVMYILATPPHVQIHELLIKPIGEIF